MQTSTTLDADHTVRLWKVGGRYYAAVDGLSLFGTGATYEAALGELDRRFGELRDFGKETGLSIDTLAPKSLVPPPRWRSALAKTAVVVVCAWLIMIPLSYVLSTAAERTVNNLHLNGGSAFWRDLDQGLIKMAESGAAQPQEEQQKTLAALRTLVGRAQPYVDEIKPLFGSARPQ